MKRLKGLAIVSSLFLFTAATALPAAAEMSTIYGTVHIGSHDNRDHDRNTKHHFNAPVPGEGVIVIKSTPSKNGSHRHDKDRTFKKVKIEINGEEAVEQRHFNKGVEELRYNVPLLASNTMKVKVKACKECALELSVLGSTESAPEEPLPPTPPVETLPPTPPVPPPLF